LKLIKEEKLSIRETRKKLGESDEPSESPSTKTFSPNKRSENSDGFELVLKKLDEIVHHNLRLDSLLEKLISERDQVAKSELLRQISSLRMENRKFCKMLEFIKDKERITSNAGGKTFFAK